MTKTEKLAFIDLAIKTVQEFIASTPDEDHYGDYEYLDLLRGLQLDVLKGVCPQGEGNQYEFTHGECAQGECAQGEHSQGEHPLNESTSKQTMKELYEVLTEAHDKAMYETLTSIYDNNYIVPKEIKMDEILDFIEEVYLGEDDKPKASNHNVVVLDKEWLKSNKWWITSGEMEKHALLKAGIEVYDAGCDFDEEVEEYPYITHDLTEPFAVQTTVACKNFTQIHCINGEPVLLH